MMPTHVLYIAGAVFFVAALTAGLLSWRFAGSRWPAWSTVISALPNFALHDSLTPGIVFTGAALLGAALTTFVIPRFWARPPTVAEIVAALASHDLIGECWMCAVQTEQLKAREAADGSFIQLCPACIKKHDAR